MKRQVFFSFHYSNDNWRASQVRNMGIVSGDSTFSDNDWEEVKLKSDAMIKLWIDSQMAKRSCVVVLIGEKTAGRKWINYEIEKAILYFTQESLASGGVQEYTIDTGQDRQTVKRSDLSSLYVRQKELLNIISILETRVHPTGGAVRVQPW